MWLRRYSMLFILMLGCASAVSVAEVVRDHDVTLDDYFTQSFVTDAIISPDGRNVVYFELRWEPPRETRNPDLWVASTTGGAPRRLTFEFGMEAAPQWSPDGQHIYYLASRKRDDGKYAPYNNKPQVWRISVEGGEATPITRVDEGIEAFQLANNGQTVYYTVSKDVKENEWKALQSRFDKLTYGHGKRKASEVWKLDLQSWRSELVVAPERFIFEFTVSPDERRVAMITTPDEELISMEGWSQVDVYDAQEKKTTTLPDELFRKLAPSPFGWLKSAAWSSDGSRLAFIVNFDGYPAEIIVAEWQQGAPRMSKLARPKDVHVSEERLAWHGGSADLYFLGNWRARQHVYRVRNIDNGSQGLTELVTPGDVVVANFSVARLSGTVAVVKADPVSTEDVYVVVENAPQSPYQRLTQVNPQMRRWKLPQVTLVEWKGADGEKVEGILELPPDYRQGSKPLPLVLDIHGGPTADTPYCLRYWVYGDMLFAAKGYARLSPNYRGSVGYGDKFMTQLIGRQNDIEVKDLLLGVDAMIARGIADPARMGVMGWSNGGFLTNAVVTADTRFKAASSGAGVLNQFLQWGLEDTPGHVINFLGGKLPWQGPDEYRRASPSYQLDKVKTPMLIHVGENDERVPAEHARVLHRALQRYLKVPTQLVIYPGEPHGLMQLEHRRAKMVWDHAWFDHYLLGKPIEGK